MSDENTMDTENNPLDLAELDTAAAADQGAVLALTHPGRSDIIRNPDGSPGLTLRLLGSDSDKYRKLRHKLQNKRLRGAVRKGRGLEVTAEQLEEENLDLLVACTIGWDGFVLHGQTLAFTADNVRMVFQKFPWVREQAAEFIEDRENFLGNV